jgi:hypothetical protein
VTETEPEESDYLDEGSELVNDYESTIQTPAKKPPVDPRDGYRSTEYKPDDEQDFVYLKKNRVPGFDRKSKFRISPLP